MRDLRKNQVEIFYSLYIPDGTVDRLGNKTGIFKEKQQLFISLSTDKGEHKNQVFGKELDYDREMVTTDMNCPIDEFSKIWINDKEYTVSRVATSRNQKRYAIKKVT